MAKYTVDGAVLDTAKARSQWEEDTYWNGNNHISRATGSQWDHETLYQSSKGRYYLEHTSQWQGRTPSARLVSPEEAARWLLVNGHELPEDLEALEESVSE